ncbi:hypothetical protein OIU84_025374 [Salix udensis]|uniref:Secreted protein n=1 Tax=Salix udensis TaxID=889485 RepID=A0AAD6KJG5_9ROSI|nr:hypothetical protein OIU84_025374 [Salix udensis]
MVPFFFVLSFSCLSHSSGLFFRCKTLSFPLSIHNLIYKAKSCISCRLYRFEGESKCRYTCKDVGADPTMGLALGFHGLISPEHLRVKK